MKKIVFSICIIVVLVGAIVWGVRYNSYKVVNDKVETLGVELDINDSIVEKLKEKVDFPNYAKASIYKTGGFDLENIPNELVLELGFTKLPLEAITNYTNRGLQYVTFTKEELSEEIKRIFGPNIQYEDEPFDINYVSPFADNGCYYFNPSYKDGIYKVDFGDGGGPSSKIFETVQKAVKVDNKIELYVNTEFYTWEIFGADADDLAIFREFDFENDKFIDYVGASGWTGSNNKFNDKLNTYVYTFELDTNTGEYYLCGFNLFEEGNKNLEKDNINKEFPLEYKITDYAKGTLYENGDYVISGTGWVPEGYVEYENEIFYYPFLEEHELIKRIIIEDGINSIFGKAFSGLENLTEIRIPSSVKMLDKGFVDNTNKSLKKVTFYNDDNSYSIEDIEFFNIEDYAVEDFILYNKTKSEIVRYMPVKKDENYKIPDTVYYLREKSFEGCNNLKTIELHKNVTHYGKDVFVGCDKLIKLLFNERNSYSLEGSVLVNKDKNIFYLKSNRYFLQDLFGEEYDKWYTKLKDKNTVLVKFVETEIKDVTLGTGEAILNNGTKIYVDFEITEGKYYDDSVTLGGRQYKNNYSGKSQFRIYTDKSNKLGSTVYTKDMGYQLIDRNYEIEFQDYNEDGNPDFVFEKDDISATWSGYSVYSIFDDYTIKEIVEDGKELFTAITHDKFLSLPKRNKGFVFKTYSQQLGDSYNEYYEYDDVQNRFVFVGNDLTEEQKKYLDEVY